MAGVWCSAFVAMIAFTSEATPQETLSAELARVDAAVIAIEVGGKEPLIDSEGAVEDIKPNARFKIVEVVKGAPLVQVGNEIDVLYFGVGRLPAGTRFYVTADDSKKLAWEIPRELNEARRRYLCELATVRNQGSDRLPRFLAHWNSPDEFIARDAQLEISRASPKTLRGLKPRMNHDEVVRVVKDTKSPGFRRRVAVAMLASCGSLNDFPMLETLIASQDEDAKQIRIATVSTYLILRGTDGMDVVDQKFKAPGAAPADISAWLYALRPVAQADAVPRDRLIQSGRLLLDRPDLADLAIPFLREWEDWESSNRIALLAKRSDERSFVRRPAIQFLRASPHPAAKGHLDDLKRQSPAEFERALEPASYP